MNTRRTGTIILLAGALAFICISPDAPAAHPKTSFQTAQAASQDDDKSIAEFEAALESHKEAELKLQSRIRDLEEAQNRLIGLEREQRNLIEQAKTTYPPALPTQSPQPIQQIHPIPEPRTSSFNWMLGGATIFALALCVILLLRMQRPKPINVSWTPQSDYGEPFTHSIEFTVPAPSTVTETEPYQAHPFTPALPDWDSASPALDSQSLKALVAGKSVNNRNSTIELAEIMLSFGRINSAAEALTAFIEKNPKEAFAPWLKLLEVYRTDGQRTEFDKIAHKLNKTFNVWAVDWDNFDDALSPVHSLETTTHIVERLQRLWGTRKCQAYLQYLLRDTRDETRKGFSLAAIDDILCLNDILGYRLGPYTGPTDTFDEDSLDDAPLTETGRDKPDSPAPTGENGDGTPQADNDEVVPL